MADKTKYYYLKIKENFFDSEEMRLLESMDNGYIYSNILMKMYLLSLKNGGKLMYKDKIPYNSKMLSTILNHNVDILESAIKVFKELNLIEILDSGAIFMLDIQNYIGKSSDEADRIREYRNKISTEKRDLLQMYDKCTTNFANIKDRDKDKDIDKEKINKKELEDEFEEIWKYYPKKVGKSKSLCYYIKARKEGVEKEKILNAVINYAEEVKLTPTKYIKHGSTWFNGKYWEDEIKETEEERMKRLEAEVEEEEKKKNENE